MSDAAKAEGATETEAATKSASAHRLDTAALNEQRRALDTLTGSAQRAQQWTEWGGRNDPGAHLSDMAKTLEYKRLINIQNWLTFTNPQSAFAWREKERQQAIQMNYAVWGGYTTPDQYLGYLQRQRTGLASLNDVLLQRAQIYRDNASAALSYDNAVKGTHATAGTLSEHLDLSGVSQFQSALAGLPDVVTTRLAVDDAAAIGQLAQYEALLKGVPRAVSTSEVLTAATALGGVSLDTKPQVIPVSYGGPYQHQFAAIMAEVAALSKLHAEIPVSFQLPSAAQVASFVSQIPTAGITEPVHLAPQGGAVGVGAGPPPQVIAAWNALRDAESGAVTEAKLAGTAETAAGASAAGAVPKVVELTAAWKALSAAEKAARLDAVLGPLAGGGGAGKPPAAPPAAAAAPGEEPPADAAAKWAALSAAEKAAAIDADLAAVKFAALAAAADGDATEAAKLAYAYKMLGGGAAAAADSTAKEVVAIKASSDAAVKGTGFIAALMTGWGFWTAQIVLFGGAFAKIPILGVIQGWHLATDVLIETLAAVLPALAFAAAALVAFGLAGAHAANDIVTHLKAVSTVSSALGTDIRPLAFNMKQLTDSMKAPVVELYGGAINALGSGMGLLAPLAQKTASVFDNWMARVDLWLARSGTAIHNFLTVGSKDLSQFGSIASSVGSIFGKFLQATAMTQISEKLLGLLALAFRGVADAMKLIPAPLLAVGLGLHAALIYGGLFVNTLQGIALSVTGLAAKIPGLSGAALQLAQHLGASSEQIAAMAKTTPAMDALSAGIAKGEKESYLLASGIGLSDANIAKLVARDSNIQAVAKSLGTTAENVAGVATGFAKSGQSVDEFAARIAGGDAALAGLTGKFTGAEKEAANLAVYMANSPESAAAAVGKLDTAFQQAASDAEKSGSSLARIGSWIAGNWVLVGVAVAAGLAYIVYWSQQADKATQTFITNLNASLAQMTASQAWRAIPEQISWIRASITDLGTSAMGTFGQMGQGWKQAGVGLTEFFTDFYRAGTPFQWLTGQGKAWGDTFMGILHGLGLPTEKNKQDIQALTAEQQKLVDQWTTMSREALLLVSGQDKLAGKSSSVTQAFGLMDLAGVKATDSFSLMKQKVDNLVTGWYNLGVQGGTLANAVNAVTLQTGLQQSKIKDLIGAWDAFFTIVNKGPSDFVSFAKGLAQVSTDAQAAGANMQGTSAASLTLRGDFLSAASGGQQLLDQLYLQNAAAGNTADGYNKVTAAGKDIVRTMIPMASGQQDLNQLFAIAQQAGYQGADSYKAIAQWAGTATGNIKAAHDPMSQLNKIESALDTSSANLATDVKNLADAIDTNLNNAVASAIVKFPGLQKAADTFFGDLQAHQGDVAKGVFPPDLQTAGTAWWKTLVGIYGTGGSKAHDAFIAEVMAADPGLTKAQAEKLWQQISGDLHVSQKNAPVVITPTTNTVKAKADLKQLELLHGTPSQPPLLLTPTVNSTKAQADLQQLRLIAGTPPPAKNWQGFWGQVGGFFNNDVFMPVDRFVKSSEWAHLYTGFMRDFGSKVVPFFTGTVHGIFTHDIPQWWDNLWSGNMQNFHQTVWVPLLGIFGGSGTIHGIFTHDIPKWWNSLWSGNMQNFHQQVYLPFDGFFTNWIPVHIADFGRAWLNNAKGMGRDFQTWIINPFSGFFTNTLPRLISNAVKGGVNTAISHLNSAIHLINDVTTIVGIPPIKPIGYVAASGGVMPARKASGSIAGTGDEDGTHIIAMGGEYMLRKPARMALEAEYGRGYMDYLNQADTWLGAGSRGNTASQQLPHGARRMASGGNADPVGSWAQPGRIDQGVDYGGAGPLYAISHGTITNLYNAGWPGGAFVGLRMDQGAKAGQYWYYAEDIAPLTNIGATVQSGQHIANATGGGSGIEIGFAAPPADGMSMASATGETKGATAATGWGVAASDFIKSLGGPGGNLQGAVAGGTPGIPGGFSAIWQNLLGLLDAAGGSVSSAVAALGKYVSGGAGALLNLAKSGSRALFDGVWSGGIDPIINAATPGSTSIPGSFLKYSAAEVKAGVDSLLGAKDSAAQASAAASNAANAAGAPGPGGGNAKANAALAQKLMPAWGSGTEWLAWNALEMAEAGWNQFARNPSSGAYGIPQALPPSKMGAAANPPQSNPTAQINWMISYIKSVYGDPIGANRHENMFHWYPSGGVIGGDGAAAGGKVGLPSSAGLVGLPSNADPGVYSSHLDGPNLHLHPGSPGNATLGDMWMKSGGLQQLTGLGWAPYDLPVPVKAAGGPVGSAQGASQAAAASTTGRAAVLKALGSPAASAMVTVPKTTGGTAGAAHNALVAAGLVPTDPNAGIKGEYAWPVAGTTPAAGTEVAARSRVQINALSPVSGPSPAGTAGMTPVEAWAYYSGKLGADATNESTDFWNLQLNAPLPSTATTQQWESDYAWLLILRGQQDRLMKAWNTVNTDLGTPGNLGAFAGAADWQNLENQAATLESWIGGNIPPRSAWGDEKLGAWPAGYPVGQIAPSGWASWKYQNSAWTQAKNSTDVWKTAIGGAQTAWNELYGPSGSITTSAPTPGVQVQPAGNTGPVAIDLQSLVKGGPYSPVSAVAAGVPLSATGSGFAGGGPMPSISMAGAAAGGEVSMADVANMFAMGGSIPVLPSRSGPQGLVGSLDRLQNGQGNARSVTSSASRSGDSIGVQIGNLNVSNPVAERPSDTITRSTQRLAFLAGRDIA